MELSVVDDPDGGEDFVGGADGDEHSLSGSPTMSLRMRGKRSLKYLKSYPNARKKAVFSLVALLALGIVLFRSCSTRLVNGPSFRRLAGIPPQDEGGRGGGERTSGLMVLAEVCAMLSQADAEVPTSSSDVRVSASAEGAALSRSTEEEGRSVGEPGEMGLAALSARGNAARELRASRVDGFETRENPRSFKPPLSESDLRNVPRLAPGLFYSTWDVQQAELLSNPSTHLAGRLASKIHCLLSRPRLRVEEQLVLLQHSRLLMSAMYQVNAVTERRPLRVAERIGRLLFAVDALARVNMLFSDITQPYAWWGLLVGSVGYNFSYRWKKRGTKAEKYVIECLTALRIYNSGERPSAADLSRLFNDLFSFFTEHYRLSRYHESVVPRAPGPATVVSLLQRSESHQGDPEGKYTESEGELRVLGRRKGGSEVSVGRVVQSTAEEGVEGEIAEEGGSRDAKRRRSARSADTQDQISPAVGGSIIPPERNTAQPVAKGTIQISEEAARHVLDPAFDGILEASSLANIPSSPTEAIERWQITPDEMCSTPNSYMTSRLSVALHMHLTKSHLGPIQCHRVLRQARNLIRTLQPLTCVGCENRPKRLADRVAKALFAVDALHRVTTFAPEITQPSTWWARLIEKLNIEFPVLWKTRGTRTQSFVDECRAALQIYATGERPTPKDLSRLFRIWLTTYLESTRRMFHMTSPGSSLVSTEQDREGPSEERGDRSPESLASCNQYQALLQIMRERTSEILSSATFETLEGPRIRMQKRPRGPTGATGFEQGPSPKRVRSREGKLPEKIRKEVSEALVDPGYLHQADLSNVPQVSGTIRGIKWIVHTDMFLCSGDSSHAMRYARWIHQILKSKSLERWQALDLLNCSQNLLLWMRPLNFLSTETKKPYYVARRVGGALMMVDALYRVAKLFPEETGASTWWNAFLTKLNTDFSYTKTIGGSPTERFIDMCRKALKEYASFRRPDPFVLRSLLHCWHFNHYRV